MAIDIKDPDEKAAYLATYAREMLRMHTLDEAGEAAGVLGFDGLGVPLRLAVYSKSQIDLALGEKLDISGLDAELAGKPTAAAPVTTLLGLDSGGGIVQLEAALTPNVSSTGRFGMQDAGGIFLHENRSAIPSDKVGLALRTQANLSYTGGTPGVVVSNSWNQVVVGAAITDFIWAGLDILDNSAAAGDNVSRYMQSHKRAGAGPTFAAVSEVRDYGVDPTSGAIAHEFDVWANGTDANSNRVGVDIVAGMRPGGSGVKPVVSYALRIGPQNGNPANATITDGIRLNGDITQAIDINSTGSTAIRFTATANYVVGINFALGAFSGAPIRLAADQKIQLEATGAVVIGYESAGTEFVIKNGATERFSVNTGSGAVGVNGTQVLGPRATGYTAMTGTANAVATYDTATVTLAQLAGRVMALQTALTNHGLIGT